jgi:hypothetical protein
MPHIDLHSVSAVSRHRLVPNLRSTPSHSASSVAIRNNIPHFLQLQPIPYLSRPYEYTSF